MANQLAMDKVQAIKSLRASGMTEGGTAMCPSYSVTGESVGSGRRPVTPG